MKVLKSYIFCTPIYLSICIYFTSILGMIFLPHEFFKMIFQVNQWLSFLMSGCFLVFLYYLSKKISFDLFWEPYLKLISFIFDNLYNKVNSELSKELDLLRNKNQKKNEISHGSYFLPNELNKNFNVHQGFIIEYPEFDYLRNVDWEKKYPLENFILEILHKKFINEFNKSYDLDSK